MQSRQRQRTVIRWGVLFAAVGAFLVLRDRLIDRNRARYGPPPLTSTPHEGAA